MGGHERTGRYERRGYRWPPTMSQGVTPRSTFLRSLTINVCCSDPATSNAEDFVLTFNQEKNHQASPFI